MVKMRVYYNNNNRITGFSNHDDPAQSESKYGLFSVKEVEDFILGKKSTSQYKIVENLKTRKPEIHLLELKDIGITLRSIDSLLTQLPILSKESPNADLYIINNTETKTLLFRLNNNHRQQVLAEQENDKELTITINGISRMDFFFTIKDNPSFLVEHITFAVPDLILEESLEIKYLQDLNSCSLFTQRLYNNYEYIMRN